MPTGWHGNNGNKTSPTSRGRSGKWKLKSFFTKLQLLWSKPGLKRKRDVHSVSHVFKHGVFPDLFRIFTPLCWRFRNKKIPRKRWKAVLFRLQCSTTGLKGFGLKKLANKSGKTPTDRIFPPFGGASLPRLASWNTGNPPKWRAVEVPLF